MFFLKKHKNATYRARLEYHTKATKEEVTKTMNSLAHVSE
jgi:hypothetical protein